MSALLILFLLYSIVPSLYSTIHFTSVTQNPPWTPRYGAQLHSLHNNLTYYSSTRTQIAPVGSFLLFGGFPQYIESDAPQLNDVWISSDHGSSWDLVTIQPFSANASTYCSDPITDASYLMTYGDYFHPNQPSPIWTSQNQSTWTLLTPTEPRSRPFTNRAGFVCTVDSHGYVYYTVGYNSSNALINDQFYADVWQSTDFGSTWRLQSSNQFSPRYASMIGIHLNNSHLNYRDIIYVIGGVNNQTSLILRDVWASSDQGVTWLQINPQVPWGVTWSNSFYITTDGVLIILGGLSYGNIWTSLDGGITWGSCDAGGYPDRWLASINLDIEGYLYIMAGYNKYTNKMQNDVWRSQISFKDLQGIAAACNLEIPSAGIGLTSWPNGASSSSSSSTGASSSSSSSSSSSAPSSTPALSAGSSSSSSRIWDDGSSSTGIESNSSSATPWMLIAVIVGVLVLILSAVGAWVYYRSVQGRSLQIRRVQGHHDPLLSEGRVA